MELKENERNVKKQMELQKAERKRLREEKKQNKGKNEETLKAKNCF